jgi:hypothetical protein
MRPIMQAVVTKPFSGVKDGEVLPREFAKGDTISGDLAEAAVRFKDAKETDESKAARETFDNDIIARDAVAKAAHDRAAMLADGKLQTRAEFDKRTPEQIALDAAALGVDLTDITDRDAIFERLWAAMVVKMDQA